MTITKRDIKKGDRVQLGHKTWNSSDPTSKTLLQCEEIFAKQYPNRKNLFTATLRYYRVVGTHPLKYYFPMGNKEGYNKHCDFYVKWVSDIKKGGK